MLRFFSSALFGGLVILLPLLFLIVILDEFLGLLIQLATPIADLFPQDFIDIAAIPEVNILAILIIACTSLVVGILAKISWASAAGRYFETYLDRVPVYRPLKTLLSALLGATESGSYQPVLYASGSDAFDLGYIVEDNGGSHLLILLPWTPNSFAGSLKLVPRERLTVIDLTFDEYSLGIAHYGHGLTETVQAAATASRDGARANTQ